MPNQKASLIDNIFSNITDNCFFSGNLIDKISDHMPNFLNIEMTSPEQTSTVKVKKRDFSKFNSINFLKDLEDLNLDITINRYPDTNSKFNVLHKQLLFMIDIHAPFKTISKKEAKLKHKPWITNGLLKSISIKNQAYKRFVKTQQIIYYEKYKTYRNKLNHLLRKSKFMHFKEYFDIHKKNSKKLWSGLKDLINNRSDTQNCNVNLEIDSKIISDETKVASEFNNFFVNVGQKLRKNVPSSSKKFDDYLTNPEFMREMFVHKESMYNLRRGKQLVLPPTKTVFGVNSLIFRGAIAWNHLPKELKEVPKLSIFKKHLNKYEIYCHCKICS